MFYPPDNRQLTTTKAEKIDIFVFAPTIKSPYNFMMNQMKAVYEFDNKKFNAFLSWKMESVVVFVWIKFMMVQFSCNLEKKCSTEWVNSFKFSTFPSADLKCHCQPIAVAYTCWKEPQHVIYIICECHQAIDWNFNIQQRHSDSPEKHHFLSRVFYRLHNVKNKCLRQWWIPTN